MGSCLLQNGKPIAFASRSLTEVERRSWAQIEKEMGAVLFGLNKFRQYTFGRKVTVITDHKPLETISKKPLSKSPKRLQNMLLRAMEYNYTIVYRRGKSMYISDALSRAPCKTQSEESFQLYDKINRITVDSPVDSQRLDEIRAATNVDPSLCKLRQIIMAGWPDQKSDLPQEVIPYFPYRDELCFYDGIVYRGDRIVVPISMRKDMRERVHAGHQGLNSCLRRARDLIFWPHMTKEITEFVQTCAICAAFPDKQAPEPLLPHEVPKNPWEKVGTDIYSIKNRNYLVTVDYLSGFF